MDTQLCIICGKTGNDFINIFKTDGLKHKIETCLPVIITPHCLLPESICTECQTKIENFYIFIKSCLQNIIILESQLDIAESCLKSKRKKDKSCFISLSLSSESKSIQTEDFLDLLLGDKKDLSNLNDEFPLTSNFLNSDQNKSESHSALVDYEILSDSNSNDYDDELNRGQVILGQKFQIQNYFNNITDIMLNNTKLLHLVSNKNLLSESTPNLIDEISERSNGRKRKGEFIENSLTKICRLESTNRRKCKQPKKLEFHAEGSNKGSSVINPIKEIKKEKEYVMYNEENEYENTISMECNEANHSINTLTLFQTCLLCKTQLQNTEELIAHFIEVHAKDYIHGDSKTLYNNCDYYSLGKKKKTLPNLLKISDLKRTELTDERISDNSPENPILFHSNLTCSNCPAMFSNKNDLFLHLQLNHSNISIFLCGICLFQVNSLTQLKSHVENCVLEHPISTKFYCQVCCFGDDNFKVVENHVLVHNFLLKICQKEIKNFDPEDYICTNEKFNRFDSSPVKYFTCVECNKSDFDTFRKFSHHRRNVHSIFHCDLCNKFYGRNSHLWKHVNRLHKAHPSITCQICFKTSASKYHLAQHFAKIHQTKTALKKDDNLILSSFNSMEKLNRQYMECLTKQESEDGNTDCDENSSDRFSDQENEDSLETKVAPKEIDPSHDLYNNIITNYTPPTGEGVLKCPKCSKTFHKKMLLKKHKKNCRPRLQKDLLTRCKSCARIFKDRQSLAKHLINYHSDYICEICNEKVQSKCEIVSHIRFQHPSSHLVCTVCENILRCQKDLLDHLGDHENSYVCQFCGDALSSKIKLKMHILSLHRKILSLSCGICLKLFENQKVLRDHVTCIHKNQLDPLTSCPVCGKNYGSKWKTYDHINKSHGTIFKTCKVCLELHESEAELETHMKITHLNHTVTTNSPGKTNLQLNNIVKTEPVNFHFENNQNDLESDSEENSDENENNSDNCSDSEGDVDNDANELIDYQRDYLEQQYVDIQNPEMPHFSLLEKRLLGNKDIHDSNTEKSNNDDFEKPKLNVPKKKKIQLTDGNPLTNHSKRTVYVNSNDPSCCEICHKTWPAKKHLWQHYIRCHKQAAATVCGICLKTNKNYENLQIHLKDTHPTLLHGQGFGSNFICRICGRYHNASSKLRLHMVIHENFDWNLLDRFPEIQRYQTTESRYMSKQIRQNINSGIKNEKKSRNIQTTSEKEMDFISENNEIYDEMIEQVEGSSRESYAEEENKHHAVDSDDNTNSVPISPKCTNELSFNNLLQTLKNHSQFNILNQIQKDIKQNENESINESTRNNTMRKNDIYTINVETNGDNVDLSDLSEDSSSTISKQGQQNSESSDLEDEESQSSQESSEENENCRNFFRPKPEELDSAIKSISYPNSHYEVINECDDFSETEQTINSLNENEIESAVGSIL